MQPYFLFNGRSSEEFNLYIDTDLSLSSPSRRGEFKEITGKDGDVFLTDNTFGNTTINFPVYCKTLAKNNFDMATEIANWLNGSNGWGELSFSGDPDYVYEAIYADEFELQKNILSFSKSIITFTVKPYKFLRSGLEPLDNPTNLFNQTVRNARPKITIKGTGNITLKIGSEELKLKNVEDGVIIDSLYQTATDLAGNNSVWDKVLTYPLPVIKPGNQDITITGGTFSIVPRFEVIV